MSITYSSPLIKRLRIIKLGIEKIGEPQVVIILAVNGGGAGFREETHKTQWQRLNFQIVKVDFPTHWCKVIANVHKQRARIVEVEQAQSAEAAGVLK